MRLEWRGASHGYRAVVLFADDIRPILSWTQITALCFFIKASDAGAEHLNACRAVSLHILRSLEIRVHGLVGAWTGASFAACHFTFILRIIAHHFEVCPDAATIITDFDFFEALAREKTLLWLIELTRSAVRAWPHRVLRLFRRFN